MSRNPGAAKVLMAGTSLLAGGRGGRLCRYSFVGLTMFVVAACSATAPVATEGPTTAAPTATAAAVPATPGTAAASPSNPPGNGCPAESALLEATSLELSAQDFAFSTGELRATACRPTVIAFSHTDAGNVHNLSVYTEALGNGVQLFRGPLARDGETVSYEIPPLMPGTYHFICDPHWQSMGGVLEVEE